MAETQLKTATATDVAIAEPMVSKGELVAMPVQTPDTITPIRPKFVTAAHDAELRKQADAIVTAILEDPSNVTITTEVYSLGADVMTHNTGLVSLMDTKIGSVLAEIKVGNPVSKSLTEIKAQLELVNPSAVSKIPIAGWLFKRVPKGDEVLRLINERKDSVATTIDGIKKVLWAERDKALQNAVELGQTCNKLAETQGTLQEAAYVGQMVWQGLSAGRDKHASDPVRTQALSNLINDLAIQVVDIQTVDTVNVQSRLGAETLIANCRRIQQGVRRTTDILLPAVATNLGVKAAAAQQARLTQAMGEINRAAGETLADTARQIHQTSVEMERLQSEGMIDSNKLEEACNEFVMMTNELEKVRAETENKARETSAKLGKLADTMRIYADPLTSARRAKEAASV